MKTLSSTFLAFFVLIATAYSQSNKENLNLQFRGYKIGDKVDTTLYKKYRGLYFPNYLDGFTMYNFDKLPEEYKALPIATWQLKKDSSIALTLLNNTVLKITVSYMTEQEKNDISKMLTEKFGFDGIPKVYQEKHPFQAYLTFWDLKTWETKDVIVQIGYGDLKLPTNPKPIKNFWNLVYTNLLLEQKIIGDFSNKK